MGGSGYNQRGIGFRFHFKEMSSSGCPASEGMGLRPAEVLDGALPGPDLALLWASRAVCWEGKPVHCLANERGSGSATAAILLSPACRLPLPPPAWGPRSFQTDTCIYFSLFCISHFPLLSPLSSMPSLLNPPCNAPLSLAAPAPCQPCRSCQENLGKRFGQASFLSMPGARGLLLRAQGRITGASTHYTERGEWNKLLYAYSTPGFTSHLNSSPLILTEPER